jgi:hypothetical protein
MEREIDLMRMDVNEKQPYEIGDEILKYLGVT